MIKTTDNLIAVGGGDGIRLLNGINWQEITVFDGKGDAVKSYNHKVFLGKKKKPKLVGKGEESVKMIEWANDESYVHF